MASAGRTESPEGEAELLLWVIFSRRALSPVTAAYPQIPSLPGGCCCRQTLPSIPGEFHPQPLTQPYVNLSIHTAHYTPSDFPPSLLHPFHPLSPLPDSTS